MTIDCFIVHYIKPICSIVFVEREFARDALCRRNGLVQIFALKKV